MIDDAVTRRIAELEHQKAAIEAQLLAVRGVPVERWPKPVRLYYACERERLWEIGDNLHLEGEALRMFVHETEVTLDVRVSHQGCVSIVACNGQPLLPKE